MIDSDQSHPLHLRKIPRTMGDVPDGPTVHFISKTITMASPRVRARSSMQGVGEPRHAPITLAPKKLILTRRASEGSASEPSLARRVSMCKDAKLSCRRGGWGSAPGLQRWPLTCRRLTCGVAGLHHSHPIPLQPENKTKRGGWGRMPQGGRGMQGHGVRPDTDGSSANDRV